MITEAQRKKWITARDALVEIELERRALVALTEDRFKAATERFDQIEEEMGEPAWTCIGCNAPIFTGDQFQSNMDEDPSCPACSVTYADLQKDPDYWISSETLELVAKEEIDAKVAEHLAAGGSLTDPAFLSVAS